ncbi:hypothetical protein MRX96_042286 [Rhipicephalus microplus]
MGLATAFSNMGSRSPHVVRHLVRTGNAGRAESLNEGGFFSGADKWTATMVTGAISCALAFGGRVLARSISTFRRLVMKAPFVPSYTTSLAFESEKAYVAQSSRF